MNIRTELAGAASMKITTAIFAVSLLASCALPSSRPAPEAETLPADGPVTVAEAFTAALARGDKAAVLELLAPNVLIYESGGQESSRDEYAAHHMHADMAFMAALKREQLSQESGGAGASAWVATRARLSGRFKDKAIDLDSTETLVMNKTEANWRIVHVHWSSAPHRSAKP